MRRHATTIVLAVLAVALGLWLWIDRGKVTGAERQKRENSAFSAWRREDLSRVELAHEGETIVIERDPRVDSAWRMTSPRQERVDQAAAERLLTTLEFASVVRKVEDGPELGFATPRAHGSVAMGNIVMRFALGAPSPRPEGSSYFRVDDGAPFVASKELTEALLARSDVLRDRTVVPYLSLDLARFELIRPDGGFVLERMGDRSFAIAGLGVYASRFALDRVWGALAEMRAETFPQEVAIPTPRLTIKMTPKEAGKPNGELVVGDACPGHPADVLVLRTQPTRVLACAPKGALDMLLAIGAPDLVDRRPFSFNHDEIEELVLEGDRRFEIARRGTGFHQRSPEDRELTPDEAEAASELLLLMEQSTADEVQPGGAPVVSVAKARVHSGDHDEVVEVSAIEGGKAVVRRLRDDARLVVSAAIARRLMPRETSFRPRALTSETRRVKRAVLRCGTPQELVDTGAGLRLVTPAGYETDGSIVQLVDGILKGKSMAWVADRDDGSFGLDDRCKVVLAFEDGNAPLTVTFGSEGEAGIYGTVSSQPGVFVVPLPLATLARRTYVSLASLRTPAATIESVNVVANGRRLPAGRPEALREAVSGLFADRVVSVGKADVGPAELEITVVVTEGGAPRRIVCGKKVDHWRRCSVSGVAAVFDVLLAHLAPFYGDVDAGAADAGR